MDREIQKIQADYGLTVFRFDMSTLGIDVVTNPTAYGFTNVTGAANACTRCDPNKYLWWDGVHPTTTFHHVISDETYRCLTQPLVIALPTGGASGSWNFSGKAARRRSDFSVAMTCPLARGNRTN